MPLARITLIEGTSDEQKRALIARTTAAIAESTGHAPEAVRVLLDEIPANHWGVGGVSVHDRQLAAKT